MVTKSVRMWSPEGMDTLKGCFQETEWDVVCKPHAEDIDSLTECVPD